MRFPILTTCFALAACAESPKTPDPVAQQAADTTCGGQLYDGCTSDDQCESGLCKAVLDEVEVCTQTCSTTAPCPQQGDQPVVCNNMGLCRPAAPNAAPLLIDAT